MIECFKREDNPTSYWGYWEDTDQDPIHIDDIQSSANNCELSYRQVQNERPLNGPPIANVR
ncbi:hypothetical protein GPALN_012052 [Globodera pallida]|nr:hypothetical protein GPALN_012052 [Globodera pallida]